MKKKVVELVAMLKEFESPLRLLIALYHVDGYVTFTELLFRHAKECIATSQS
ncbi:MAG: hypothetical protein QW085_07410 [Pyrobaculum sp.]